jgi:hypothetical protein
MTKFLTKENLGHICDICLQYFKEALGIDVDSVTLQQHVAREMQKLAPLEREGMTLAELNKRVIVAVRKNFQTTVEEPRVADEHEDANDDSNDDTFFKKLQQLELQRKVQVIGEPIPQNVKNIAPAVTPPSAPPPPILPPSTIIVQTSENKDIFHNSRVLKVRSWDRMWMYHNARNGFIASPTFPPNVEASFATIVQATMPRSGSVDPYYDIIIEGAGKQQVCITLGVEKSDDTWVYLRPLSSGLGKWSLLACPWVVTVKDSIGKDVDMGGCDGWNVKNTITKENGNTVLYLEHPFHDESVSLMTEFRKDDKIIVKNDDGDYSTNVVYTTYDTVEVKGKSPQNGYVINMSRQVCILLEIHVKK